MLIIRISPHQEYLQNNTWILSMYHTHDRRTDHFLALYPFTTFSHLNYLITTKEASKFHALPRKNKLNKQFIPLFITLLIIPIYLFVFIFMALVARLGLEYDSQVTTTAIYSNLYYYYIWSCEEIQTESISLGGKLVVVTVVMIMC